MKYLTYIQSTGTQYIDTGFKPNQNTKIVMDLQPNIPVYDEENFNTWWYTPFGTFAWRNRDDFLAFDIQIENKGSKWSVHWSTDDPSGDTDTGYEVFSYTNNKRITISLEKTKVTLDGDTRNWTTANIQSDITLYLFAGHAFNAEYSPPSATQYYTPMKLYSCQIYDNGTLVRDFYPIEDDNGNVGLYDKVNKVFYANAGTGTFTKGEYTGETTDEPTGGGTTTISSIQFTGLTNNATYYGKIFTVNFKGRINNRADLAYCSAYPTSFPAEPSSYSLINTYTSSTTFTAPEDGWYQIELFGASGSGGAGKSAAVSGATKNENGYYDTVHDINRSGGGGGGGGGTAVSRVKMKKGDTLTITIGSTSTVIVNSTAGESYDILRATRGSNGNAAPSATSGGTGGAGGVASGGNYLNKNGGVGGTGGVNNTWATATRGDGGAAATSGGNAGGEGGCGEAASWYSNKDTFLGYGPSTDQPSSAKAGFCKIYRGDTNITS